MFSSQANYLRAPYFLRRELRKIAAEVIAAVRREIFRYKHARVSVMPQYKEPCSLHPQYFRLIVESRTLPQFLMNGA